MKFTIERDALAEHLSFVSRRARNKSPIPILSNVLIEASASTVKLACSDLDTRSESIVPAEIETPGAVTVPADRLSRLVSGMPSGSHVSIDASDKVAKVRAGRSVYEFAVLPASDFPDMTPPGDFTSFSLPAVQVRRLFGAPACCIGQEKSRPYLCGIFIHHQKSDVVSVATNGHILIRIALPAAVPGFKGIIVPEASCQEIVKLAESGDVKIQVSPSLFAVTAGDSRFVTKLIEGDFPDYARVIPEATAPRMVVEPEEMQAAFKRLLSAQDPDKTTAAVRLSWKANPGSISAMLRSEIARGDEEIECDSIERDASEIGLNINYLREIIDAFDAKRLALYIDGPGDAVRIENPDASDIVAVQMPMRV